MVASGYRVGMRLVTTALRLLEPRVDDDFVDRLHYLYTSTIIFLFAILVSAKQYVGHPIECFVPAQFTRAMEQYAESYCWVQNTYWVPFEEYIPQMPEDRERRQIGYYQWVPFALAIAALMFHMPATVWRMLSTQSGLNMSLVLQVASQEQNVDPIVRDQCVEVLTRHIDDMLKYQRDYGMRNKSVYLFAVLRLGKVYGAYVSVVYLFVKSLHFGNVVLQFLMLNKFLETADYPLFGGHVLFDLLSGSEWRESGKFPRVTLCDFEIRVVGNVHRHTVQCVLVINMFTEKIFVFLWIWLFLLSVATLINLIIWTFSLAFTNWRHSFITKFLESESEETYRFVENFLRPDGVFLLHMICAHAGTIMCARLTESLWIKFLQRNGKVAPIDPQKCAENASSSSVEKTRPTNDWDDSVLPPPMPILASTSHLV
uniref:Innexin n=1 Tax=Syphacia muris TaxID=451379 RepID=A0A158R4F1_9BILA